MALAVLALMAPIMVAIAIAVRLTSPGPAIFRHPRVGQHGRVFHMLKFRTMRINQGGPAVTSLGDSRITSIGALLRKTKLDELPELWNVVRGDMSLVGPRPEALEYVQLSDRAWRAILTVKPGITDPTTLYLRNEEQLLAATGSEYEKFYRDVLLPYKLDRCLQYLTTRTWRSDLSILWLTVFGVILPARLPAPSPDEVSLQ